MKIGIIGSSKFDEEHKEKISDFAKFLAMQGHEIVVVPEMKSLPLFFAREYLENNGKKVYSIVPQDDTEFGNSWVEKGLGEIVNCGTWRNQPEKLVEESDVLVSFGYCTGGVIEICYSKWFGNQEVYILKDMISTKLPDELERDLKLNYVSFDELKKVLSK